MRTLFCNFFKLLIASLAVATIFSFSAFFTLSFSASNFSASACIFAFSTSNFMIDRIMEKNIFYRTNFVTLHNDMMKISQYHVLWPIPQSAILGIHATKDRAVVENGQVVVRPINYLALSYDHRIIDGREAVLGLVAMKDALEDPARLLLDL